MKAQEIKPTHFVWEASDGVATITLNRPDKKNPLTFESYAELRDTFLNLPQVDDVHAIVITGAGGNFCSGGDVHEIIGPLVKMNDDEQLRFTQMTGDLITAMQTCPQVVIAAIDGVCVGAGAAIAMASDIRFGTGQSRVAFLFVKVGLAGCDMGACAILPRIIGHGRAAELLYTGRAMQGTEAHEWGFYNYLAQTDTVLVNAQKFAAKIASGPTVAHQTTKRMLREEWNMPVVDAVNAEAREQARCMRTSDFKRAYEAFLKKEKPVFKGD